MSRDTPEQALYMSLRDYIATKAMQALITVPGTYAPSVVAKLAYAHADAMLAQRAQP